MLYFSQNVQQNPLPTNSEVQATCAVENRHPFYLYILNKLLIIINLKY